MSEPEDESTTGEPTAESEPETESEPEVEPESESSDPETENWPEPGPDWSTATDVLSFGWETHVFGFGLAFILVGTISAILYAKQLKMRSGSRVRVGVLSLTTSFLVAVVGLGRGLVLLIDPYGTRAILPTLVLRLLWSVPLPALSSAFSVVLLAILDTTKISLTPPRFQKLGPVLWILGGHLMFAIVSDFVVVYFYEAKILIFLCQLFMVTWTMFLVSGFILTIHKLRRNLSASRGTRATEDDQDKKIRRLVNNMTLSVVVAGAMCVTSLYGAVGVFGVFSSVRVVDTWPWWCFQMIMRLEELLMTFLILRLSTKSLADLFPSLDAALRSCCGKTRRDVEQGANAVGPSGHTSMQETVAK